MNLIQTYLPVGTMTRLFVIVAASALLTGFRAIVWPVNYQASAKQQGVERLKLSEINHLGKQTLWIDVRSVKEYQAGHIPNAIWISETNFQVGIDKLLESWTPNISLVVYCNSNQCGASDHLASRLKQAGFSSIYVLDGGWEAWSKQ